MVERRYSDFLDLKRKLKAAQKERFSPLFPGKIHIPGGSMDAERQDALQVWLRKVVEAHSTFDAQVGQFLSCGDLGRR